MVCSCKISVFMCKSSVYFSAPHFRVVLRHFVLLWRRHCSVVRYFCVAVSDTQPFHMRFCNGVDKKFYTISSYILAIASQKLVSLVVLPYKSIHNNCDIFYDEMVLIFFVNTIVKPHVKRLTGLMTCESQ